MQVERTMFMLLFLSTQIATLHAYVASKWHLSFLFWFTVRTLLYTIFLIYNHYLITCISCLAIVEEELKLHARP